jgi:hypothetical protein
MVWPSYHHSASARYDRLGRPVPHLRRDWAHPLPHLPQRDRGPKESNAFHRDWAHPCPCLHRNWALAPAMFAPGLDSPLPTSAPGLGSPLPTSAPGLGSTLPTAAPGLGSRPCHCLHLDSTRYLIYTLIYICTGTGRTPAHDCTGTGPTPAHDCTGTGLTPATSAAGLGPPLPANFPGFQVAAASGLAPLPFRTG